MDDPRATLVRRRRLHPQRDLAYTLRLWQREGLRIAALELTASMAQDIVVRQPSWFGWALYRATTLLGLSRGSLGGFGAVVREASG